MLIFSLFLIGGINVKANTSSFYEAEYIDNIYMNKYQYSTKTIYYQKARFFRKTDTHEFAYCIEPFSFFNDYTPYEATLNPNNLTNEQIDRISKIAYFGYGYHNHTDPKWYAITQMMIWEASDNNGDYYFTDSLNGNRINPYQNEMNEINNLINSYNTLPSFVNEHYKIVEGKELVLTDNNYQLANYYTNDNITINNNSITIKDLKAGTYNFNLYREDKIHNKAYIFYQSSNSQNLIKTGDLSTIKCSFSVKVIETSLDIFKIDKDTKSITPSGEAILDGATYELLDSTNKVIDTLVINNNQASIKNLNFGTYYLKEIKAGIGYTIDPTIYEIIITDKNNKIELVLENKVIEKNIKLEKKYGENIIFRGEANISFQIFNNNEELIKTITTNSQGEVEFTLPYGKYKVIQVNSTEGYSKVDPFIIEVLNEDDEYLELRDLKIPVPNTHTNSNIILAIILKIFWLLIIC